VTKCPDHLCFLREINNIFPDAHIIWTHRDPVKVIASYSSLTSLFRRTMYGQVHTEGIGPYISRRFLASVNRAMEYRALSGRIVHDLDFSEFVQSQVRTIQDLLPKLNLEQNIETFYLLCEEHSRMRRKRSDARGSHRYSLETFGVNPQETVLRFGHYMDTYQVERELH
jgi:hypothetical protein